MFVDWHKLFLGTDGRLQWETLVSGVGASLAAVMTILILHRQTKEASDNATEQRKRRERAARAMLPVALDELAQYATACIAGLWALRLYFPDGGWLNLSQAGKPPPRWAPPSLADYVLSVIKECIEFLDPIPRDPPDPRDPPGPADALADLMRRFHAQNSQARSHVSTINGPDRGSQLSWNSMKDVIIDSAELHALACHLSYTLTTQSSHGIDSPFAIATSDILGSLLNASCFDGDDVDEAVKLADIWERRRR